MDTGHSNIYQIIAVTVATLLQFLHKPLYQITEELIAETTLWWRCKLSNFHIYGFCFPKSPKKNNPIKTKHISPIYESSGGRCLVSNVMMTPRNKGESWKSISEKKTWQFVNVFRWIVLYHQASKCLLIWYDNTEAEKWSYHLVRPAPEVEDVAGQPGVPGCLLAAEHHHVAHLPRLVPLSQTPPSCINEISRILRSSLHNGSSPWNWELHVMLFV